MLRKKIREFGERFQVGARADGPQMVDNGTSPMNLVVKAKIASERRGSSMLDRHSDVEASPEFDQKKDFLQPMLDTA